MPTKPTPVSKKPAAKTTKAKVKPAAPSAPAAKPIAAKQKLVKKLAETLKSAAAQPKLPAEEKVKKVKLVRDSFTIPKNEYVEIESLKLSLAKQGRTAKKSELLRAGLMLLSKQTPGALLACVEALAPVKTGRPKKD
jgi:hypothetical protein